MPVPAASGGRASPLLTLTALTALALLPLGQVALRIGLVGAVLASVVVIVGSRRGRWSAVRVATVGLLLAVFGLVGSPFALWPAVGVLWLGSRWWPQLRPALGWLPPGGATAGSWVFGAVTVLGAAVALTAWILSEPELGPSTVQLVDLARRAPPGAIVAATVAFVLVNPVVEEVAYRNVAYEAARTGVSVGGSIVLQAVAFATLHVVGFPAGSIGVGMSFVYGLMLGIIRVATGGLRVAVIAHVATNATIAALVAIFLLPA